MPTGVKTVIPMHYKTFGILTGTAEEFGSLITREDCKMRALVPGEVFTL